MAHAKWAPLTCSEPGPCRRCTLALFYSKPPCGHDDSVLACCCQITAVHPCLDPGSEHLQCPALHIVSRLHTCDARLRLEAGTHAHTRSPAPLCALLVLPWRDGDELPATTNAGSRRDEQLLRNAARRPQTRATIELPSRTSFVRVYRVHRSSICPVPTAATVAQGQTGDHSSTSVCATPSHDWPYHGPRCARTDDVGLAYISETSVIYLSGE